MPSSILVSAAAAALVAITPVDASPSRLLFLRDFDQEALQMLECAEMIRTQPTLFSVAGNKKDIAKLESAYRSAGRAAVVRAALLTEEPKVGRVSFEEPSTTQFVKSDLRVHEDKARYLVVQTLRSGFDTSSVCLNQGLRKEATYLNTWFAEDTSVLTEVN